MALFKITPNFIRQTISSPPEKPTRFMDETLPTFGLRITPKGKASFIAQYSLNGKQVGPVKLKGGEVSSLDISTLLKQIKQMRQIALSLVTDARAGIDPRGEVLEEQTTTLGNHLIEYLKTHAIAKKRTRSVEKDVNIIDKHIPLWMKKKPIDQVTKADIMKHHAAMQSMKPTANSMLRLLSKIFNLAIDWGLVEKNPVRGIPHYDEHPRERYLSPEELTKLDDTLELILSIGAEKNGVKQQHPAAVAIRLIMLTGSRKSEVLSAEWYMFDLERGIWSKPFTHTKQKKTVHIPLAPEAVTLLKWWKKQDLTHDVWLFPNPKRTGPTQDIKRVWGALRKELNLEDVRIHDLRHTYASMLVQNNIDPTAIQMLLGHAKIDTTLRYMHRKVDHLRHATTAFQTEKAKAKIADQLDIEELKK